MGIVIVISLWEVMGMTPQAAAQAYSARALARAVDVQEAYTESLMARPGVVGTAVGYNQDGQLAVQVFVAAEAMAAGVPERLNGMPVVVEVTGEIVALRDLRDDPAADASAMAPTERFRRPVPIGVSTGHPAVTAGTIGCRVKDRAGKLFLLSNNHVLANENLASIGDKAIQPGTFDGGVVSRDTIGTLRRFVRIDFCNPFPPFCPPNLIDAAIARSSADLLGKATPSNGYGTPESTIVSASLGQRVMKYGRTTGQTRGRVSSLNATVDVRYDVGIARFVNQIIITGSGFSAGGDSGSLIVVARGSNARRAIGLLFAGSSSVTVANPIGTVLNRLKVSIDGQ
jgi:hypothetical protein